MAEKIVIRGEGLTVDLLLWRRDGRAGAALVEETFRINPGLASLGAVLPVGTTLILPDRALAQRAVEPVSLFG